MKEIFRARKAVYPPSFGSKSAVRVRAGRRVIWRQDPVLGQLW